LNLLDRVNKHRELFKIKFFLLQKFFLPESQYGRATVGSTFLSENSNLLINSLCQGKKPGPE